MALSVRVTSDSLTQCIKEIRLFDGKSRLAAEKGITKGLKMMVRDAKSKVRVRTGNLRRSIHSSFNKNKVEGKLYGGDKQAYHGHLIEYGVKAVTVRPKKSRFLVFPGTRAYRGKVIKALKANLPRRKAYPFLIPAVENNTENMVSIIRSEIKKAASK